MRISRLSDNPIITPESSPTLGDNINGPSMIRIPDWVPNSLGRYYLYFAHHKGKHIRLAYSDDVAGPWTVHEPGVLQLKESYFPESIDASTLPQASQDRLAAIKTDDDDPLYCHVASPDVHIDHMRRQIRMYYHGLTENARQVTRLAQSADGLTFEAQPEIIVHRPYLRVFEHQGFHYGLAMPGTMYRSLDGITDWEEGPSLFNEDMRHSAVTIHDERLYVFWTEVGDAPEHILLSTVDISGEWSNWSATNPLDVLLPETDWEGANLPVEPSVRGAISRPVNQLRDPCIFVEDYRTWLLYSVAGESGIGVAEIEQ